MINKVINSDIISNDVKIYMENDKLNFSIEDTFYLQDDIQYPLGYCHQMADLEFDSVLIGGLGLGLIPYYLENYKSVSTIDVIEINQDVINVVNELNHLKNTNIFLGNAYSYIPEKKYDLILLDLWWVYYGNFEKTEYQLLFDYCNCLNEGGTLYVPAVNKLFV